MVRLFHVFKTRIEEHSLAVRTRAKDAGEPLPSLQQLQSSSIVLYNQVLEAAKQQCLRDSVALRSSPGETAWDTLPGAVATVDADGERGTHAGTANKQDQGAVSRKSTAPESAPATKTSPPPKRSTDQCQQQARPHSPAKRPKRGGTSNHHCIRCACTAHDWYDCQEQGWCPIPHRWPAFLKALAVKVHKTHGVTPLYSPEENSSGTRHPTLVPDYLQRR